MAGSKETDKKLNHTLLFISSLFAKHNIPNWFIAYGTLLGIIRGNSCINNDDDIDIVCNKESYGKIKEILTENNFTFQDCPNNPNNSKPYIIKTPKTNEFTTVDIYMATMDDNGNYNDMWNGVVWSECHVNNKLIEYEWQGTTLYLPNNYETKLINRYGKAWKTPAKSKGPKPHKKII